MKTNARKTYLAVSGGIAALGIVVAGVGFALSGFDPGVFTSTVDLRADKVVLGGTEIDDYDDLIVAGILDTIGRSRSTGVARSARCSRSPGATCRACVPGGIDESALPDPRRRPKRLAL